MFLREKVEITVTIGYNPISVTKKMNTSLLVEKLQARGVRLLLDNGQLSYNSDKPIPTGIVTTLTVEGPHIVRYLESLTPHPGNAETTHKASNTAPPAFLQELGDNAPMFEKVLELFPSDGPIDWAPAENKKGRTAR